MGGIRLFDLGVTLDSAASSGVFLEEKLRRHSRVGGE